MAGVDKSAEDYSARLIAAIEEYAIESSIMKVYGSEAFGYLVDDAVQIHGGAGYIEEYPVERAYRDARINRIFEGTNEINRMLIAGMLLKRTMKGTLPLFEVAQAVDEDLSKGQLPKAKVEDVLAAEEQAAENLKRLAIYTLKVAAEAFGPAIEEHQVVLATVADIVMDAYALDTMVTRTRQAATDGKLDAARVAMTRQYATEANARSYDRARRALCATVKGDALKEHLGKVARLELFTPYDPVELRETVLEAVERAGGYPLSTV
jgi:alkylation response protein AidB-like acyl-CoA dehydrogenase